MTTLKHIQFYDVTAEFPDGVIAHPGSTVFNLEQARNNTVIYDGTELNTESIDTILADMNRLVGTSQFNPAEHAIEIHYTHSIGKIRMFSIKIVVEGDIFLLLRDIGFTSDSNIGNADITPASSKSLSSTAIGLIRKENSTEIMPPHQISALANKFGFRLAAPDSNRVLLNNETVPTESEINRLREEIRNRAGAVSKG